MDYIFLKFLLVLKVKGRGSRETVGCLGHLGSQFMGERRALWGREAKLPRILQSVTLGSTQRGTVLFKS